MRLPYALLLGSAAALPERESELAILKRPIPPTSFAFSNPLRLRPSEIHIAYTGVPGTLSVDFVETKDRTWGYVETSCGGAPAVRSNTTSFYYDTIGQMHQGTLVFAGAAAGTACSYRAVTAAGASSSFSVTPIVSHPERFAIFGDFGLVNDIVMTDLTQQAAAGTFDSVLHVGVSICTRRYARPLCRGWRDERHCRRRLRCRNPFPPPLITPLPLPAACAPAMCRIGRTILCVTRASSSDPPPHRNSLTFCFLLHSSHPAGGPLQRAGQPFHESRAGLRCHAPRYAA